MKYKLLTKQQRQKGRIAYLFAKTSDNGIKAFLQYILSEINDKILL